jgi:hypothetical protein
MKRFIEAPDPFQHWTPKKDRPGEDVATMGEDAGGIIRR